MPPELAPELVGGPYRPPQGVKPNDMLQTPEGRETVYGFSNGPIPWPARMGGGRLVPILHGDLVKMVRVESVKAVAYYLGVSRWTVQDWRRRLGIGRMNEGTEQLWARPRNERVDLTLREP